MSPMHAHLGIFMVFLYRYYNVVPKTLLVCQILILITVLFCYLVSLPPLWFIIVGILYSLMCVYFILNLTGIAVGQFHNHQVKINLFAMIRPDNIFHYLLMPMLGHLEPTILKVVKSASSFSKISLYVWPKHVDNELSNISVRNLVMLLLFAFSSSVLGVFLLSNVNNPYVIFSVSLVIPLILVINRYLDIAAGNSRKYALLVNLAYVIICLFLFYRSII